MEHTTDDCPRCVHHYEGLCAALTESEADFNYKKEHDPGMVELTDDCRVFEERKRERLPFMAGRLGP